MNIKKLYYRVKRAFTKLKKADLLETTAKVNKGTSDNPAIFVTPSPPNADFSDALQDFYNLQDEYNELLQAVKVKKQELDEQQIVLVENLGTRANYIDSIAKGNAEIILKSGNSAVSGQRHKHPIPSPVTGLTFKQSTESGTVLGSWDFNKYADIYLVEESETPMDSKSYKLVASETKTSCVIKDRKSGTMMGYRVTAKNASGISLHSTFVVIAIP